MFCMNYEGYFLLLSSKRRKKENIYYKNRLKYLLRIKNHNSIYLHT